MVIFGTAENDQEPIKWPISLVVICVAAQERGDRTKAAPVGAAGLS